MPACIIPDALCRCRRAVVSGLLTTSFLVTDGASPGAIAPDGPTADRGAEVLVWLPIPGATDDLPARPGVFYEGIGARLIEISDATAAHLAVRAGARRIEVTDETLYVLIARDAARATFEPPARVLARSDVEVLVATPEGAPRLIAAAEEAMRGFRQLVRVPREPIPPIAKVPDAHQPGAQPDPLVQRILDDVSNATFLANWQTLEDFVTRYTFASQNLQATQWIYDQLRSYGLETEFHYYEQEGLRRNVVATLPGLVRPNEVVYICGHVDSRSPTPWVCAPGADDDASGATATIEAARVMAGRAFERTIKFACFNGEEQGLNGSEAYVSSIIAAGEEVIGVFACDMIAYRGLDPYPPDLVIYTNPASQPLAETLADAAGTYLSAVIEPVIVVESMMGSDHGSFWAHGLPGVLSIEDEVFGDDFCPWYHTCNDLIANYPTTYVVDCARASIAAVAMRAGPLDPQGSFLTVSGTDVDDDAIGGSSGDGDGLLNPGETIELTVEIRNAGAATATGISGELSGGGPNVAVLTPGAAWEDLPPGETGSNLTALLFAISPDASDGEVLAFTLTMTDASGSRSLPLELRVVAPELVYHFHRIDDATVGNANGVVDPGESVLLEIMVANTGGRDAVDVHATLTSESPDLTVVQGQASAGGIPGGGHVGLSPACEISVSGGASLDDVLELGLAITAGGGATFDSGLELKVGTFFHDDAESDGAWSLSAGDDTALRGRWVRTDPAGAIAGGTPCEPADDHTAWPGTDCFVTGSTLPGDACGVSDVDGGRTTLTSPIFDLTGVVQPRLVYWRWYSNDLGGNPGTDEWVAQISADGGASWVDLERTQTSLNSWTRRMFLLEGMIPLTAEVVVRFVAADEGGGSTVEAAVDDFEIRGPTQPVAVSDAGPPIAVRLDPIHPNPFRQTTRISFRLEVASPVALKLYGVDGRLVRTLVDASVAAGEHEVVWHGERDGGARVAPGVYFLRLETRDDGVPPGGVATPRQVWTRRLVRLR